VENVSQCVAGTFGSCTGHWTGALCCL
jgi:hypothetical protein